MRVRGERLSLGVGVGMDVGHVPTGIVGVVSAGRVGSIGSVGSQARASPRGHFAALLFPSVTIATLPPPSACTTTSTGCETLHARARLPPIACLRVPHLLPGFHLFPPVHSPAITQSVVTTQRPSARDSTPPSGRLPWTQSAIPGMVSDGLEVSTRSILTRNPEHEQTVDKNSACF